jgi:hypothetical protein
MAEIADYQIITKGPFTLSDGSPQKDLPFDLPLNISTKRGRRPGLCSRGCFGRSFRCCY